MKLKPKEKVIDFVKMKHPAENVPTIVEKVDRVYAWDKKHKIKKTHRGEQVYLFNEVEYTVIEFALIRAYMLLAPVSGGKNLSLTL